MEFTKGDIIQADVEAVVNTVNCVGVMGETSRPSSGAKCRRLAVSYSHGVEVQS